MLATVMGGPLKCSSKSEEVEKKQHPWIRIQRLEVDKLQSGKAFRKRVHSFNADIVPNWCSP